MQDAKWYGILRIVVGVALVFFGAVKFFNPAIHEAYFEPYPAFFMPLIGVLEIVGGAALAVGWLTRWAALGLAVIMAGAVVSHFIMGITPKVAPSLVLLLLTLLIAARPPQRAG